MKIFLRRLLLTLLFPLCMWAAWPPRPLVVLVFVAWIPLLILEKEISASGERRKGLKVFGYGYLAFLLWNLATTWWVGNTTSPFSGLFANAANPLLMGVPLLLFYYTKKNLGNAWGYVSLVVYWMSFEWIHLQWELSWPWLTLGNVFALSVNLVPWYRYTGVFGGTLWVWLSNLVLLQIWLQWKGGRNIRRTLGAACLLLLLPLAWAGIGMLFHEKKGDGKNLSGNLSKEPNVVVVQPNIDPYNEKFDAETYRLQMNTLLRLTASAIDSNTALVVWPETSLPGGVNMKDFGTDGQLQEIRQFLHHYPQASILTGVNLFRDYATRATPTARKYETGNGWWDAFNSAILVDTGKTVQFYHKCKLVPGAERMPYPAVFHFLEKYAVDMGGISGSLGTDNEPKVFLKRFRGTEIRIAPLICYESIYGDYVTGFVRKGANLLCIMTNDGWWGNTAGHVQHQLYGRLRAVETGLCVVRSANTGTSCFVQADGSVSQPTGWWKEAVIREPLRLGSGETFYVKHGDYLARLANALSVILLGCALWRRIRNRISGKRKKATNP